MSYQFKFTERNIGRGTEFETKSLLYLIGIDKDHTKICIIFVDCFNDITGSDENYENLWDFQSKGVTNLTYSKIGKSLFTLFFNYNSELRFLKYALFMPNTINNLLIDPTLIEFGIRNFKKIIRIKKGLSNECHRRIITDNTTQLEISKIDSFLEKVTFIVDFYDKYEYVKNLTSFKNKDLKSQEFYLSIFEEIQIAQHRKKIILIHNRQIESVSEALLFEKHIRTNEIILLLINRLIGIDLFNEKLIPINFLSEVHDLNDQELRDLLHECKVEICRAIFDKNCKNEFWTFLEKTFNEIIFNRYLTSREIYQIVINSIKRKPHHLSEKSSIFLISLVKEGMEA